MKTVLFLVAVLVVLVVSCTKQNSTPVEMLNEMLPPDSTGTDNLKFAGNFSNGPFGSATGTAKVYLQNNQYLLALTDIAVSNGPDLHVYLSRELQPIHFIDLGKLKSTKGNQLYEITGSPDFLQYSFALIHCQQYNHLFGSAALK